MSDEKVDHEKPADGQAGITEQELGQQSAAAPETAPPPSAEELAEVKDRLLRSLAETENVRRQKERDVEEARRYAVTGFARGLLEISDNLARALQSVPAEAREQDGFLKNLVLGVEMTERSLLALFERHQIKKIMPERGERFDHNRHQAMFEMPTAELPPGTVAEVMQAGYVIADRLLRPAMVGVAKAPPGATPQSSVDKTV